MKNNNKLLCFLILLILSSCGGDYCIDADNFGFPQFIISSRYPEQSTEINGVEFDYLLDYQGKKVGAWIDSGYTLNGQALTVMVRNWKYDGVRDNSGPTMLSAWCPWFGNGKYYNSLPSYLLKLRSCQFHNNNPCSNEPDQIRIPNAPCLMTKGSGLYGLITLENLSSSPSNIAAFDPNSTVTSRYDPSSMSAVTGAYTFHVGDPSNNAGLFDVSNTYQFMGSANSSVSSAGGIVVSNTDDNDIASYAGGKLYFKILDTDYSDNAGQYIAVIKSGVRNLGFNPFRDLADQFRAMIFGGVDVFSGKPITGIVPMIYTNILKQSDYRRSVNAMLILYILFTGMGFLIGLVKFTQFEFVMRTFKIILISILLTTETSWSFFYDYLFNGFINGFQFIIGLVESAATGGQTQGGEDVIALILSEQTIAKLTSLLLLNFSGWAYFIIFMVLIVFIVIMYLKAYIMYISSLLLVGIIVSMAPIFLCFMLFNVTQYLYSNWLKKLIVYSFQPIILFTSLAFLGGMVRDEVYYSLGFRVCKLPIIDIGLTPQPLLSMYYPEPQLPSSFAKNPIMMAVPKAKTLYDASGNVSGYKAAYSYQENRYPDLPFLDPTNSKDNAKIQDVHTNGLTVDFEGLVYLILITWALYHFNNTTLAIATTIIGSPASASIQGAADQVGKSFEKFNSKMFKKFSNKMNRYSTVRMAVDAYRMVKSGAKSLGNSLANVVENPLLAMVNNTTKEKFIKESPFLAGQLGVTASLENAKESDEMWRKFSYNTRELAISGANWTSHRQKNIESIKLGAGKVWEVSKNIGTALVTAENWRIAGRTISNISNVPGELWRRRGDYSQKIKRHFENNSWRYAAAGGGAIAVCFPIAIPISAAAGALGLVGYGSYRSTKAVADGIANLRNAESTSIVETMQTGAKKAVLPIYKQYVRYQIKKTSKMPLRRNHMPPELVKTKNGIAFQPPSVKASYSAFFKRPEGALQLKGLTDILPDKGSVRNSMISALQSIIDNDQRKVEEKRAKNRKKSASKKLEEEALEEMEKERDEVKKKYEEEIAALKKTKKGKDQEEIEEIKQEIKVLKLEREGKLREIHEKYDIRAREKAVIQLEKIQEKEEKEIKAFKKQAEKEEGGIQREIASQTQEFEKALKKEQDEILELQVQYRVDGKTDEKSVKELERIKSESDKRIQDLEKEFEQKNKPLTEKLGLLRKETSEEFMKRSKKLDELKTKRAKISKDEE